MERRVDQEWWALAAGLALAGVGWGVHATLLALAGALCALTALTMWVWQRQCLTGVTYSRTLHQRRAIFGEEVALDVELVNDKLLPLTWLHVEDDAPFGLSITGGTVIAGGLRPRLHHLLPLLPFQRVRRRLTVVCDHRGDHAFGPARLSSGDPFGLHRRSRRVEQQQQLLVYPKLFGLESFPVASRVPLGELRARITLIDDPSRVAGVRDYRPGDPLRHIDWRATARANGLLVREFEQTATVRAAVFVDMRRRLFGPPGSIDDVLEFTIAVGASIVSTLVERGVATGLYASGLVDGHPIVREPGSSPAALPAMLELLARATVSGSISLADLLVSEGARLSRGTSIVVVSAGFTGPIAQAITELRRRTAVTGVWVAGQDGQPPPAGLLDLSREVDYDAGWKQLDVIALRH